MINIVVRVRSNRISNLQVDNALLHRAITDREMIGLVSEIKPELVVYEYCDGDNIESIKTTLDGLAIPLVLISDQEYTDKKVYSKDNLNEILEKGYKEYAINQEESLVSEEVGDTPLIEEPNQSSSTVNCYKEQICIQLEQENDLLKEEKKQIEEKLETVESERDTLSKEVNEYRQFKDEINNEFLEYNSKDENSTTEVSVEEHKESSLSDIIKGIKAFKENTASLINELQLENKELRSNMGLLASSESNATNAEWFKQEFDRVTAEYEAYKEKTNHLLKEAEEVKEKQENFIADLVSKHEEEFKVLKQESASANILYNSLMELYNNHCERDIRLLSTIDGLKGTIVDLKETLEEKESKIEELTEEVKVKEDRISELVVETSATETTIANAIAESKATVDNLNTKLSLLGMDYESIKLERDRLAKELASSNQTIASMSNSTKEMEYTKDRLRAIEASEHELRAKVELLMKEKKNNLIALQQKAAEVNNLKLEISRLESDLSAYRDTGQTGISQARNLMDGKYTGKAKIINCYGIGSSGITTIATSIAKALANKNVLLLDLDIVNPRCEMLMGTSPTLTESLGGEAQERTSYNILIEKGTRYVLTHLKDCLIQVSPKLFYFSGVYRKINRIKLTGIDFSLFLNKLGEKFDYIVVDCGHLGISAETDSVIKTFHEIAHKNIMITENEQFSIRSGWLKLSDTGLNMSNSLWLLNMATVSRIPKEVRDKVSCDNIIIPREMGLNNKDKTFLDNMVLRTRLKEILKKVT